jgi:hypothetical protein
MVENVMAEFMRESQIGIGVYVSVAAGCYFAFVALKKYLVASA